MSVRKRRRTIQVAVIIAVVAYAVTALAAGLGVSGYERLKTAGFRAIEEINKSNGAYSNGTFWITAAFYIDDELAVMGEQTVMREGDKELSRNATHYGPAALRNIDLFGSGYSNDTVTYSDDDVYYRWYGENEYSGRTKNSYGYSYPDDDGYDVLPPAQKRLIEAVADALIGDTRNYFIHDENVVSISLSGNQIPEIAQFAVAAFAERANIAGLEYNDGPNIGSDARITNGLLVVELDDYDNVTGAKFSAEIASTVNDKIQTFRLTFELVTKNLGTTVVTKPDGNAFGMPILPSLDDGEPYAVKFTNGAAI